MEIQLEHPPHVRQHPQTVFAMVGGFCDKYVCSLDIHALASEWVKCSPRRRSATQILLQVLKTFRVAQYRLAKCLLISD
jgi:hypothetical protein